MEYILPNKNVTIKTHKKTYECKFLGTQDNFILAEHNQKPIKFKFDNVQTVYTHKQKPSSLAEQISNYKKIYEGNLLPMDPYTIKIDAAGADLLKLLLRIGNPDQELKNTTNYSTGLMTFHNPEEYKTTIDFLKKNGYTYSDIGDKKTDTEKDHTENIVSPYPKNVHDD